MPYGSMSAMKFTDMLKDFRQFLLRGNVVDLAVAVVIGAAFTAVVNSLVKDLITPLIAAIGGKPNFANLSFKIHGSVFMYGDFFNALLSFLIMAGVVFFLVVQPINHLIKLAKRGKVSDAPLDPQVVLLEEIRDLLKDRK
jgi:large conductance mechanosensitive channel